MNSVTSSVNFSSEERIRSALAKTWHAFFASFARLHDVQKASILPILAGKSVLVNAPTASGKTEAVLAPTVERYLQNRELRRYAITERPKIESLPLDRAPHRRRAGQKLPEMTQEQVQQMLFGEQRVKQIRVENQTMPGPAILVVVPTKALCNDLFRRLQRPIRAVGLTISVRTGDKPVFDRETPPEILITTPESLDSLLSRQTRSFTSLESIVIDEIHLLSASGRGDQLQCLLTRLRKLNKHPIACCASSATVPELDRIAKEFLGNDAITLSVATGTRNIVHEIYRVYSEYDAANLIEKEMNASPDRKMIVFANTRALVENLVITLKQKPRLSSIVFAHHGSLSKESREKTEKDFLESKHGVCVATSTLELGIDIGDVDLIVLVGPPSDVTSFAQRIGRGNRKQDTTHVVCLAGSDFDARRFEHLIQCAQNDRYFPDPVRIRPTTIVQQAFSLCLQKRTSSSETNDGTNGWIAKNALYERLSEATQAFYSVSDCEAILNAMVDKGYLRRVSNGKYVPDGKTDFLFDRGYMHSMIEDRGETAIIDATTGRNLGSIRLKQKSMLDIATGVHTSLTIGGKTHDATKFSDGKLYVQASNGSGEASFNCQDAPRYSLRLAQDFAHFMHIPVDCLPLVPSTTGGYRVDHYLGTIGACFMRDFLVHQGCRVSDGDRAGDAGNASFYLYINARPMLEMMPNEDQLKHFFRGYIMNNTDKLLRKLQPGPWVNMIPEEIMQRWMTSSINIDAYAKRLARLPIKLMPEGVNYDDM